MIWRGGQGGRPLPPPAPLPPPSRPLVSLLPSGAARASRAQKFPLSPSLPFSPPLSLLPPPLLPPPSPSSPSSRPLFSLLPPPLLPPPAPSSPPPSYPVRPLWYKRLNFIDFIVNANYCNDTWKIITKQQITKYTQNQWKHLYSRYLSYMDLSTKVLFSSNNCILNILWKDCYLHWLIVNMHCLKLHVQKQGIRLPVMLRMRDLYFFIVLSFLTEWITFSQH